MASKNLTRDMTRIVMKKINDDKRRKEEAVRRYVAAIAEREAMRMRIREMETNIDAMREKAREAGVSASELKTASREAEQTWHELSSTRAWRGEGNQRQAGNPSGDHPGEAADEGNEGNPQ